MRKTGLTNNKLLMRCISFFIIISITTSGVAISASQFSGDVFKKPESKFDEELKAQSAVDFSNVIAKNRAEVLINGLVRNAMENETEGVYLKRLNDEGFDVNHISLAKMLVERVITQIRELSMRDSNSIAQLPGSRTDETDQNKNLDALYSKLLEGIDPEKAVYLMLKLEKEYGSLFAALDEYLYSLQLGIDLEGCLTDKAAYEKEKAEKQSQTSMETLLNTSELEERFIEKMQSQDTDDKATSILPDVTKITIENKLESIIPKPEIPRAEEPKPESTVGM